jgi:hypothetical protein
MKSIAEPFSKAATICLLGFFIVNSPSVLVVVFNTMLRQEWLVKEEN